jgi:hypothetical protein
MTGVGAEKGGEGVRVRPAGVPRFADWREAAAWVRERLTGSQKRWLQSHLAWEAEDLDRVDREYVRRVFLKYEPGEEPGERVPTVDDSRLLRTLIWQFWMKLLAGQAEPVGGNLRSFWYHPVGPFYRRHRLDRTDRPTLKGDEVLLRLNVAAGLWLAVAAERPEVSSGSRRKDYLIKEMTRCLGEFVVRRFYDFRDLGFLPDEPPYKVGTRAASILVFTEKQGMRWLVEEQHASRGVTCYPSNGEPSLMTVGELVSRLRAKKIARVRAGGFCDHEPYGYNMLESLDEKFRVYGMRAEVYLLTTTDLFDPEVLEHDKRPLADTERNRRWVQRTGGIHGELFGIHVDLARHDRLRQRAAEFVRWARGSGEPPWLRVQGTLPAGEWRKPIP